MLGQVESCALETLTDISVTRSKWICCATTESDELAILDPANNFRHAEKGSFFHQVIISTVYISRALTTALIYDLMART